MWLRSACPETTQTNWNHRKIPQRRYDLTREGMCTLCPSHDHSSFHPRRSSEGHSPRWGRVIFFEPRSLQSDRKTAQRARTERGGAQRKSHGPIEDCAPPTWSRRDTRANTHTDVRTRANQLGRNGLSWGDYSSVRGRLKLRAAIRNWP